MFGCVASGTALINGAVDDHENGPGSREAVPALITNDRFCEAIFTPSVASTASEYVPMSAVPGLRSTSPVLLCRGCTNVADAPAGNPLTERLTVPVLPFRPMVTFTRPIEPPAGTVTVPLDN